MRRRSNQLAKVSFNPFYIIVPKKKLKKIKKKVAGK